MRRQAVRQHMGLLAHSSTSKVGPSCMEPGQPVVETFTCSHLGKCGGGGACPKECENEEFLTIHGEQ